MVRKTLTLTPNFAQIVDECKHLAQLIKVFLDLPSLCWHRAWSCPVPDVSKVVSLICQSDTALKLESIIDSVLPPSVSRLALDKSALVQEKLAHCPSQQPFPYCPSVVCWFPLQKSQKLIQQEIQQKPSHWCDKCSWLNATSLQRNLPESTGCIHWKEQHNQQHWCTLVSGLGVLDWLVASVKFLLH